MDSIEAANAGQLVCPKCGSTSFYVVGTIGFRRPFDSASGAFGTYDLLHGEETPLRAECAVCFSDVTTLFARDPATKIAPLELAHTA